MRKVLALIALTIAAIGTTMEAQVTAGTGAISGTVRDASGAAVPNATVVVSNETNGITRNLTTSNGGVFAAPALTPTTGYMIKVTAPGFAPFETRNIQVQVGQNVDIAVNLSVTAATTAVDVTAAAPIVDDTRTDVQQVINQQQIDDLPINGRRADTFALLTPGVTTDGTFGDLTFRGVPAGNTFLTDGNDTTNMYYQENAGRTRILAQISQDAVQEFQVLNSGYSAEYGRATGGIVNTVTRSGSNSYHGTLYWFFRNRTLNARDRYASFNPPEYRHQAGASIGGPIIKNKLFFFANTEITRRNFPLASSLTSYPTVIQNGQFLGCTATAAQCAAANALLPAFSGLIPREQNQELGFAKIDWHPNDRNTLSFSFNYMRFISPNGIQTGAVLTNGSALTGNGLDSVRDRYARFAHTYVVSPSVVNEFRFGWFKDRQADQTGLYQPAFGNLTLSVNGVALGIANYLPRVNPSENRFQYADTLTWTIGKHILKYGFDLANTEDYVNNLSNQYGTFSYGNITAFATDYTGGGSGRNYQSFSQTFGNPIIDYTVREYAAFVQDEWRILPSLTLNLGVRYDYSALPTPTVTNPDYPQTGKIPTDSNNLAPRVGFAYHFPNRNTVIRGGYGIFYDRYTGGLLSTLLTNNNLYTKAVTIQNTGTTPNPAGPAFPGILTSAQAAALPGGSATITFADQNLRTPYTQNGDLAVEQQLTKDMALTVSYIFNRGVKFFTVRDLNIGAPGPAVTYQIADLSGNIVNSFSTPTYLAANRIDPRYLRINEVENGGRTYYDGLAVQLNKRFSHSFQGTVSYTWSHAIDTNLGGASSNVYFSSGPSTFYPGDYRSERGSSGLDQRHRATISFIYEPVITKRDDAFSRYVLKGWQISSITTLATPQYVTPTVSVSGTVVTGAAFSSSLNGFGGNSRVPFLPLSSVALDPITRVDARVTKTFPFTERYRLYLNFEAFNVSNSQYNTSVDGRAYTVSANRIFVPSPTLGVGTASAGFPDGTNARRAQVSARFIF